MKDTMRIAILYPAPLLESVPCLYNFIYLLTQEGYNVDIFVTQDYRYNKPVIASKKVSFYFFPLGKFYFFKIFPQIFRYTNWVYRYVSKLSYKFFIGVDPVGLISAAVIGRIFRKPWVYFSLELNLTTDPNSFYRRYKAAEKLCCRDAAFVITQDETRGKLIAEDNNIPISRLLFLPNAPLKPARIKRTDFFRRKFKLSKHDKILLHAGGFGDWIMANDLARLTSQFPHNWKLIFHLRYREDNVLLAQYFGDLFKNKHIYISNEPLRYSDFEDAISSADIGLALYKVADSPNRYYMGKSSGKLCHYLHVGLPVIVTNMPYWKEKIAYYHSGITITNVIEILNKVPEILDNYSYFSHGAVKHFNSELSFEPAFNKIVKKLALLL